MSDLFIRYLNGKDIDALAMSNDEILQAIEFSLSEQGRGNTVIEPRTHLIPDPVINGHFNVLRGYIGALSTAGIKVVGDYKDNFKLGLPSEFGLLNLLDARTGQPRAVLDATAITEMRTGAVTAIGAKYLAPPHPRILGHVGARGTAHWNIRLLDHVFDFKQIRVHSKRPESRQAFADRMSRELGKKVVATDTWQQCLMGADVLVEASRLSTPEPLLKSAWIKPGALVIPYGTISAVEDDITDMMHKIVVDDWRQCLVGPFGCLRRHVDWGRVTGDSIHGELGEICAGKICGRESDEEKILFWHRGLATSDIALGHAMLEKADRLEIGLRLVYR